MNQLFFFTVYQRQNACESYFDIKHRIYRMFQKSPIKKKTVYLYYILIKWADFFLITEDSLKFLLVHQQLTETFEIQHLQLRYEI
jgi:hypothetical protein